MSGLRCAEEQRPTRFLACYDTLVHVPPSSLFFYSISAPPERLYGTRIGPLIRLLASSSRLQIRLPLPIAQKVTERWHNAIET